MSRFGDGLAAGSDLLAAAEEATATALGPLGGRVPDLLCVFATGPPDDVEAAFRRIDAARRAKALEKEAPQLAVAAE